METLQRKKAGTGVISVRVPSATYTRLVDQRRRAKLLGFNFNATLAGILGEGAKQIHKELIEAEQKAYGRDEPRTAKRRKAEASVARMVG